MRDLLRRTRNLHVARRSLSRFIDGPPRLRGSRSGQKYRDIDHRVRTAIQGFPGGVSLYAKNLYTGTSYELRADAPVPTKSASEEMINVLKRRQDHQRVGRDMKDTVVASKSGALDHLRSEAAIVYSPHGPLAMSIT